MQATYKETYKLESMDTSFGVPYPCRTRDMPRTLLHPCLSFVLFKKKKILRDMAGRESDTYFLFLFSFDFEHFSSYLLFTLLDLILWFVF